MLLKTYAAFKSAANGLTSIYFFQFEIEVEFKVKFKNLPPKLIKLT